MRIAAFVDGGGQLGDFLGPGSVCVFEKCAQRWRPVSSAPLALNDAMSLGELKRLLGEAVHPISSCQVFLVREFRGVFKVFLEDWGFHVWKSQGALQEQLEQVAQLEALAASQIEPEPLPQPQGDAVSGLYHIDLNEALQSGSPHVSRDILIPFFDTVSFARLEIICDHMPRWLPFEVDENGLRIASQARSAPDAPLRVVLEPARGERTAPKGRRKRNFSCSCGG